MARTAKNTTKNTEANKEASLALKSFKTSSEVESFYTFIYENGLRSEAHKLMEVVLKRITPAKKRGRKKVLQ
ncbi:MAG: hypothetical protein CME62_10660 [Halobacteriovoraceae bacterium]|nr:hypothetical protein [Halobacteriovoraceae bacterium]|tara:strand:- start:22504 stop:22719 length:216 start_codon:yes stop_codon:yes gene_type:complete